jgi:hypothetical protein
LNRLRPVKPPTEGKASLSAISGPEMGGDGCKVDVTEQRRNLIIRADLTICWKPSRSGSKVETKIISPRLMRRYEKKLTPTAIEDAVGIFPIVKHKQDQQPQEGE